jgi:glutathione S-transferase
MLKLFHAPDTCALASVIVMEELGLDYEIASVDFSSGEQHKPDYLAVNPKGRVPALVTGQGILTETPSILVYLCQQKPEGGLVDLTNPWALAKIQEFNSYLASTLHVAHAHRMRGSRWADEPEAIAAMQRKVPETVGACYDLIEQDLLQGPWVMGEAYTICDPYLFTMARWLEADGVDPAGIPKVMDHRARMGERAAAQRALAYEK